MATPPTTAKAQASRAGRALMLPTRCFPLPLRLRIQTGRSADDRLGIHLSGHLRTSLSTQRSIVTSSAIFAPGVESVRERRGRWVAPPTGVKRQLALTRMLPRLARIARPAGDALTATLRTPARAACTRVVRMGRARPAARTRKTPAAGTRTRTTAPPLRARERTSSKRPRCGAEVRPTAPAAAGAALRRILGASPGSPTRTTMVSSVALPSSSETRTVTVTLSAAL